MTMTLQDDTEHDRAIRHDERLRLADLLTAHRDALADYTSRPHQVVDLIALLLRLDEDLVVPRRHSWGGHLIDLDDRALDPMWHVSCTGCGWTLEAPVSQAIAAGRDHEALNLVDIR